LKVFATIVSETPGSSAPLDDMVAAIARFADPVIGLPRQQPRQESGQESPDDGKPNTTLTAIDRIFGR
jgi:hypothetical protein